MTNSCIDWQEVEKALVSLSEIKRGDQELALFYLPHDRSWRMDIGCPSPHVMLGEVDGDITVQGETLIQVIKQALIALNMPASGG
jgi:hypothetical protein